MPRQSRKKSRSRRKTSARGCSSAKKAMNKYQKIYEKCLKEAIKKD